MKTNKKTVREARPSDVAAMQSIRNTVKENILSNPDLITEEDYIEHMTRRGKAWVCEMNGQIRGFASVDLKDNNVWALFVDHRFEGSGIGRALHDEMLNWYFAQGKNELWLSTSPGTRAELFYRKSGWKQNGMHGNEIKFEMYVKDWLNLNSDETKTI